MANIKYNFKTNLELQSELGTRFRRLRLEQNMPRAQLAEKAGVAVGSIAKIESGSDIRLSTLIALLRALGCLDQIMHIIPDREQSPLEMVDLGHERIKARRFGKKPSLIKDAS